MDGTIEGDTLSVASDGIVAHVQRKDLLVVEHVLNDKDLADKGHGSGLRIVLCGGIAYAVRRGIGSSLVEVGKIFGASVLTLLALSSAGAFFFNRMPNRLLQ